MLDLNNFRMKFLFFFVSRGGDSPPPRAPPQSPRPRRFGTLFISSLLFIFSPAIFFLLLFFSLFICLLTLWRQFTQQLRARLWKLISQRLLALSFSNWHTLFFQPYTTFRIIFSLFQQFFLIFLSFLLTNLCLLHLLLILTWFYPFKNTRFADKNLYKMPFRLQKLLQTLGKM